MASRLELHEEFCDLLGNRNAYFQPPPSVKLQFDCIKYSCDGFDSDYADDHAYKTIRRYEGIAITKDPDSGLPDAILKRFQMCSLGKPYVSDNLNHFPFTLYY